LEQELSEELKRFYFLIETFEETIEEIEKGLKDSTEWFVFCSKIGKKFLLHLKSFIFNVNQDLLNLQIDGINISNELDISILYTNLRLQMDTYSTFHHLFIHKGDWEEKIIRFRLWEMDALISRQNFSKDRIIDNSSQLESEKKQLIEIYQEIKRLDFFKDLNQKEKSKLIKISDGKFLYANWKFDKNLLSQNNYKYTWTELALNTGLKPEIYSDMHNFTSMHVHSSYISILQNEQITNYDKHEIRMVNLRVSCYLTCLYLDDLCARFKLAKNVAKKLNKNEFGIIETFIKHGRLNEQIKYFA